jgi:hypothetical protein
MGLVSYHFCHQLLFAGNIAPSESSSKGLLIVLSLPGEGNTTESTFNATASAYLSISGVLGGESYIAQDDSRQVAILDMAKPDIDTSIHQTLADLSGKTSNNGHKLSLDAQKHRIYKMIIEKASEEFPTAPSNILLLVSMQPGDELTEEEFHNWYEEEHTPLFSQIPGWLRTRRAELVDTNEGMGTVSRFLALYEWEIIDSFNTDEYRHATSTVWQKKVLPMVD